MPLRENRVSAASILNSILISTPGGVGLALLWNRLHYLWAFAVLIPLQIWRARKEGAFWKKNSWKNIAFTADTLGFKLFWNRSTNFPLRLTQRDDPTPRISRFIAVSDTKAFVHVPTWTGQEDKTGITARWLKVPRLRRQIKSRSSPPGI